MLSSMSVLDTFQAQGANEKETDKLPAQIHSHTLDFLQDHVNTALDAS